MAQCHDLPRINTFRSNNYVRKRWDRSTEFSEAAIAIGLIYAQASPRPVQASGRVRRVARCERFAVSV